MQLASGGMGSVELVLRREGKFARLYAVKRLKPAHRDDESFRTMFVDEARIAGLLRHPNVVSVLDVGEDQDGPFLLMDYVDGISVSTLIRETARHGSMLPAQLCARIVKQVADGLHAAHELRGHDGAPLGLVHRDVSPQNILVGFDGTVRVTDFGIAKAFGRDTRTTTGVLKGKIGYFAPEQLRFEHPDKRSDLFSMGVVFYEMLTGRRLYEKRDPLDTAREILESPSPIAIEGRPDLPADLARLVVELLAKQRDERPADARTVSKRLERILHELALVEEPLDIGEWIDANLGELRDKRSRDLVQALEAHAEKTLVAPLRASLVPTLGQRPALVAVAVPLEETSVATNELVPRPPMHRWWPLAAIAVVLIALGVSAAWIGWAATIHARRPARIASRPRQVAPPVEAPAQPTARAAPAPVVAEPAARALPDASVAAVVSPRSRPRTTVKRSRAEGLSPRAPSTEDELVPSTWGQRQ